MMRNKIDKPAITNPATFKSVSTLEINASFARVNVISGYNCKRSRNAFIESTFTAAASRLISIDAGNGFTSSRISPDLH